MEKLKIIEKYIVSEDRIELYDLILEWLSSKEYN